MTIQAASELLDTKTVASPTSFANFWNEFSKNKMAVVGLSMLLVMIVAALLSPILASHDIFTSEGITSADVYQAPSAEHWFGTDDAGKDVYSSFLYGAGVSLIVGFFAAFISIVIGGVIGIVSGFYGGRVEASLMRFTDVMMVIPDLPLMVVIIALTKPSLFNIILVIGLLGWTTTARIVRSQTLSVKSHKFVLRARAIGGGNPHIIRHHILPLVLPLMVVQAVLVISTAIINESTLSFLGLGDPTTASWGQMLYFAFQRGAMSAGATWALAVPGFGILWVVLGLTLFGQGLEQVLNPKLGSHHLMAGRPIVKSEAGKSADVLLDVQELSIHYIDNENKAPARAVEKVSFTLKEGELIGLVGESGCGKTTLMLGLLRLLPEAGQIVGGHVYFAGNDLMAMSESQIADVRWKDISIVFQGAMNALNPVRTVGDQIAEAIIKHIPEFPKENINARVLQLLDLVGINAQQKDNYPHEYSGGMRQRAMIAMALACNPRVIIADEPTTALDVMIQAQILELLDDLRKKLKLAIIFVTHDLGIVAEICDSVLVMYGGVTAEYANVDTIYNAPKHPYTQELLKAFPDLTIPEKKLTSIPGYPPKLNNLPAGCRFAPRCPLAFARCHTEQPALHSLKNGDLHLASCHLLEESK